MSLFPEKNQTRQHCSSHCVGMRCPAAMCFFVLVTCAASRLKRSLEGQDCSGVWSGLNKSGFSAIRGLGSWTQQSVAADRRENAAPAERKRYVSEGAEQWAL